MAIFGNSSSKPARRRAARSNKNNRRRPPYSSGRGKRSTNKGKLVAAIAAPIVALGGAGYGIITLLDGEKPNANHCYLRDDQHQAVIFVDNSVMSESGAHIRDYRTGMMRVYENAPANSLIKITTTARTEGSSFAPPSFTLCKPAATQEEQAAIGAPEQSQPLLNRIAGEALAEYTVMVDSVIADMQDPDKAAHDSPILEQLQAISRYDGFEGPNRSLTLITDGINNSETARFCTVSGGMPPFETFRTRRSYEYVEPRSYEGMDVTILLVEFGQLPDANLRHCSNDRLRDWWPAYFEGNGAQSVDLRRLRYWQDS